MLKSLLAILAIVNLSLAAWAEVESFSEAKKILNNNKHLFDEKTLYCGCRIVGKEVDLKSCGYKVQKKNKRATRLEWEHVVPAEAFGQSFKEWRQGDPVKCVRRGKSFKGRKCAQTNAEFRKMESDLYNLVPEIGELNALRSNFSMAQLRQPAGSFGSCAVKIYDRKFEPADSAKGVVARTYMNFEHRYPGRGVVSDKNRKLFEAWHETFPITTIECRRWLALEKRNGYRHLFADQCKG